MPFGPFYSQEEKNKINAAQQRNSGYKPRPVRGDGEYTNKNKGRSGANQIDVTRRAQETVTPPPAPSAPASSRACRWRPLVAARAPCPVTKPWELMYDWVDR